MREDKLARQMFYGGCALLPWLWVVNVLYFRKVVYDPIPLVDYLPGGDRRQAALDRFADGSALDDDEDGPIENLPQVGNSASDDTDAETEFEDDDGADGSNAAHDEARLEAQIVRQGVEKWVKRSTMSATLVFGVFVAWIAVFQAHKDSFGPKWFVMSEEEGERTGW
jgi:hypothetical protein